MKEFRESGKEGQGEGEVVENRHKTRCIGRGSIQATTSYTLRHSKEMLVNRNTVRSAAWE